MTQPPSLKRLRGFSADSVMCPPDAVPFHSYRAVAEPVSKLLKEGTKKAHKDAENVHFVREFIHCRVSREVYRKMVYNLKCVYSAMEEALAANADHPLIKIIHMPLELNRKAELAKDLEYYYPNDEERRALNPTPVAQAYCERLRRLGAASPELLVPHAYTRYLGDLSGGQVLKRAAIKGMGLKKEKKESGGDGDVGGGGYRGVSFYDFRRISNMREFKQSYRDKLDKLDQFDPRRGALMDESLAVLMVAEANYAFELNTAMFHELDVLSGFAPPDDAGSPQSLLPKIPDPDEVRRASLEKALQRQRELQEKQRMEQQMEQPGQEGAADAAKDPLAGCPFASLVRATGMPMPANHPGTAATGKGAVAPQDGLSKKTEAECASGAACEGKGCPMRNFGLVDYAIVLIFAAIFLLMMPPADQQASLVGRK